MIFGSGRVPLSVVLFGFCVAPVSIHEIERGDRAKSDGYVRATVVLDIVVYQQFRVFNSGRDPLELLV